MRSEPVYLWTLPMYHCNGWTFTWGITACGGTNVCLRNVTALDIYQNIVAHREIVAPIEILTGGAPPPPALILKMESLGFHTTHAYGLTEATGPALVCEWQANWNRLPP
ncbi:hypothetical protein NL676_028180 [Syzygium grande]|nr:hypothetical protein NL676_028180 [Syzygium grande]